MLKIDRRLIRNFDWATFSLIILLSIIGIMTIYSATRPLLPNEQPTFHIKQIYWLLIGMSALFLIVSFDYIWLSRFAYPVYAIGIVLLLIVLFAGKTGMGAQRWLSIGPLSFQPSEIFRLMFIIVIARHFMELSGTMGLTSIIKIFLAFTFIPLIILLKQPDLGTAVILLIMFLSLSIVKGLQKKKSSCF